MIYLYFESKKVHIQLPMIIWRLNVAWDTSVALWSLWPVFSNCCLKINFSQIWDEFGMKINQFGQIHPKIMHFFQLQTPK